MRANHPYILITEQTASIKGYILGLRIGSKWKTSRPLNAEHDLKPILDRIAKIEEIAERLR